MATIQSGDVFNVGSNRILNGDASVPAASQRPLYIGRNTLRGARTAEVSVRYIRIIPVGDAFRVQLIAESANNRNRTNPIALNSSAAVDQFGEVLSPPTAAWTGALDQRLFQVGLRVSF